MKRKIVQKISRCVAMLVVVMSAGAMLGPLATGACAARAQPSALQTPAWSNANYFQAVRLQAAPASQQLASRAAVATVSLFAASQEAEPEGAERANRQPWSERHPAVLPVTAIVAFLLIGLAALRSMK